MNGKPDYNFKLLLLGESGVGKSCVLLRYADNTFSPNFISTIGVDFKMKTIHLNDKTLKMSIWDTAGQERYRTIVASFYRGANGILLIFDVTDINTFLKIRTWIEEIKKNAPESVSIVLVGNKSDITAHRMVDAVEAGAFADKHRIKYVETSAKSGEGIQEAFETLAAECIKTSIHQKRENGDVVALEGKNTQGGCC
ncbi:hypothetical protein PROFUN_13752 [Planoprotostelium fungivorum]|uniref:Uncharacterized protein n=1 Tax=Planoprotostelium fungivorum TaxID=1890364 RepID=A0A2P6N329_9EUKA|nr:hypothetical protein PROFUN_13752 [Planoprotostelium fungivorum]